MTFPLKEQREIMGVSRTGSKYDKHGGVSSIYGKLIMNDYALSPVTLLNYFSQ